ncbi:hypothetical protein [Candidatus Magnetominusculus xianensis]|nr:hypothetical protein [Candidatus Magnetominusculus xianensis]MBF0404699.1 hypothetical protein [Nitrospirota bacterium]
MEIKFAGEKILPETIRARDLAELVSKVEESLTAIIVKDNADVNPDDIVIGLVNIEKGSTILTFESSRADLALNAFTVLSDAIATGDYYKIPSNSVKGIKSVYDFIKKGDCVAEFRTQSGSVKPLAFISPQTEIIFPTATQLSGKTVIYGKVIRAGGKTPIIGIELIDNRIIYCDVSESIAKVIARRLYCWVGFSGIAKWNADDYSIESFNIEEIIDYEDMPITKSISKLSLIAGRYFQDDIDVVKIISEMRS